jgi:hypothetical protein
MILSSADWPIHYFKVAEIRFYYHDNELLISAVFISELAIYCLVWLVAT